MIALVVVFIALLLAHAVQLWLIMPLESWLFPHAWLAVSSLLYLPMGLKVVAATLLGVRAIPVIFLSSVLVSSLHFEPLDAVIGGALGAIAVVFPVAMINLLNGRGLLQGLSDAGALHINLWRSFLFVSVSGSILNSYLQPLWFGGAGDLTLNLRYLIGDLAGCLVAFSLLLSLRKKLIPVLS